MQSNQARRVEALQAIAAPYGKRALAVKLDVTDAEERAAALKAANDQFGHIDILANIAGAGAYGAVEEFTSEQNRDTMELNFFAPVELSKAVLPQMRQRKSGHILNLTSIAGLVAFPGNGLYSASKFALEGWTEALHHEVKGAGVRVTLIEPGAFRTGFAGPAIKRAANAGKIDDYAQLDAAYDQYFASQNGKQPGDPVKAMKVVIDMVDSESAPVRLLEGAYDLWDSAVESRAHDLAKWKDAAYSLSFPGAPKNPVQAP